jgi:hypothetical protein
MTGPWRPDDRDGVAALQLIGDGLISALARQVKGAAELATDCVSAGQASTGVARDGTHPDAAITTDRPRGTRGHPGRRPHSWRGPRGSATGEVWPRAAIDYAQEIGEETDEDEDRWLSVAGEGSRESYRDMEAFIESLADPDQADRLWTAIQGPGAFRRFKDALGRTPDELNRWFAFSEERQRGRARAWLVHAGYNPSPRPPSSPAAQPI